MARASLTRKEGMASHGHGHDDALLWRKLHELEMQLAAYKLLRGVEGEEEEVSAWESGGAACCRGRQYDAYMRRRDERRAAGGSAMAAKGQRMPGPGRETTRVGVGGGGGGGGTSPLTIKVAARDTQQVRRTSGVSIPITPRKEHGSLPRCRTVSGGAASARPQHQRRNSVAGSSIPADFLSDSATPRPFLRRGSGTGGAVARLRTPRVHDLPTSDLPSSSSPRRRPQDHSAQMATGRHLRSVSELPFHATAAMGSPRPVEMPLTPARARKRWGSPETPPPAMFSAAATNPHMDLAKGLRKLLSFVRKSKSTDHQHCQPRSGGVGGGERDSVGKPVTRWTEATACSVLDGPFDRASLERHQQFPMTRAVGTSR